MSKTRLKRILMLLLLVLTLSTFILEHTSAARRIPISSADLYSRGTFAGLLRLGDMGIQTSIIMYNWNGVSFPAYCLNRDLPGVEAGAYSVSIDSLITNELIWRIIINGYPYRSYQELGLANSIEAFTATKQAVFCILYDRHPSAYSSSGTDAGDRTLAALHMIYNNAMSSAARMTSPELTVRGISETWEEDSINYRYVSMVYTVTAQAPMHTFEVSLSGELPEGIFVANMQNEVQNTFRRGEEFKILVPITNLRDAGNFMINAEAEVETKPIFLGRAPVGRQDYALTGFSFEIGNGSLREYYSRNETKIIVLKQDAETEMPLEGVEFELLDENQNVIYARLVTDEYGKIEIGNLIPGRFYIRETRALEGYIIYDGLIQVEVGLNEVITVIVNNSPEEVVVEVEREAVQGARRLPRAGF